MGKFNKKDEGVKPTIVNHMGEKAYKPNAAYIAGFVGNCADEMFGFLEEEKNGKEE